MQHLPDVHAAQSNGQRGRVAFGSSRLPVHQPILFLPQCQASAQPLVRFSTIVTCVFVYAVSLFVAVSELLTLFRGAATLRGGEGKNGSRSWTTSTLRLEALVPFSR
jgi:hypothetical protein